MIANIMRTHFFQKIIYDWKCHFYIMEKVWDFITLRTSDIITILTFVVMDNFCPCFYQMLVL